MTADRRFRDRPFLNMGSWQRNGSNTARTKLGHRSRADHAHAPPTSRKTETYQFALIALGCALAVRLVAMVVFPLTDTTEARYGEIARLMLETGDWITPYFDYGVPFWAKPPLAFWLEAGAFRLLGVNEFAGRLPSLLATIAGAACLYRYACDFWNRRVGVWALVILSTSALVYVSAGAILIDPFLAFGTTLSMVSLAATLRNPRSSWRYLFFIGLAVGLLAKGPVALVLVLGSVSLWATVKRQWPTVWRAVPWIRGALLTAALTLPWYGLAEMKTPGYLHYFLVGEHWMRFTEAGWGGDLYGSAHKQPLGMIWVLWLGAAFPWGLVAVWRLLSRVRTRLGRRGLATAAMETQTAYLLSWALFPMIFFTLAGNILWTYVLPALPAFAVLLAVALVDTTGPHRAPWRLVARMSWISPVLLAAAVVVAQIDPSFFNTEKFLVQFYDENHQGPSTLTYIGDRPFSARFYSRGQAGLSTTEDVPTGLAAPRNARFIAVPKSRRSAYGKTSVAPPDARFASRRFDLIERAPPPDLAVAGRELGSGGQLTP